MNIDSICCDGVKTRIVKGGYVQVGLITSTPWLVLLSFVHCMSVAMYCQIERCVSQSQLALAFQLAQLHALND